MECHTGILECGRLTENKIIDTQLPTASAKIIVEAFCRIFCGTLCVFGDIWVIIIVANADYFGDIWVIIIVANADYVVISGQTAFAETVRQE